MTKGDEGAAARIQETENEQQLVEKVTAIFHQIRKLSDLSPSKHVNALFTELVALCTPPSAVSLRRLGKPERRMREQLIRLCGQAEGLMERHYAALLLAVPDPLGSISLFPYYDNYRKLAHMEYGVLAAAGAAQPRRVAFVGSGPMPLTTVVMATEHMHATFFDNYDLDATANALARRLIACRPTLARRVAFHTTDVMAVTDALAAADVVVLAALVGLRRRDKAAVLGHVGRHVAPGKLLLVRSAHGARAFLYPVVDEADVAAAGFHVVKTVHPTDEVINSVILCRKGPRAAAAADEEEEESYGASASAPESPCRPRNIKNNNN